MTVAGHPAIQQWIPRGGGVEIELVQPVGEMGEQAKQAFLGEGAGPGQAENGVVGGDAGTVRLGTERTTCYPRSWRPR